MIKPNKPNKGMKMKKEKHFKLSEVYGLPVIY